MELKNKNIPQLTIALIIIALVLTVLLIVVTVMSLLGGAKPQEQMQLTEQTQPAEEPTAPPTEPKPTLPPPEDNPYDRLDFQYEGRYLKLRNGDCRIGVDVSHWQQTIDWEKVKASGVDFAIIKLGGRGYESGALSLDRNAFANLDGALAAGLEVGVYFFSQALTSAEAEEEAYFVVNHLEPYAEHITMPVVFDWEHMNNLDARANDIRDPDLLTECTIAFLQTIEAAGYRPMVYFNRTQARYYLNLEELTDYEFWLAAYTQRMDFPYKIKMWQYTCEGEVPGIPGPCDINIYFPNT